MKPQIIITSILMLFMSSSISWGQEPIDIDEIYEITQLSTSEHKIHGSVFEDMNLNYSMICPFGDASCGFMSGTGLEIRGQNKKLLQKLAIQCREKICTVTGTIYPKGKIPSLQKVIEITSYSVGKELNSQYVHDFLLNNLHGKAVFYEGIIDWGSTYDEIWGISKKYQYESPKFDVSYLTEEKKLEILEFHNNCTKGRITGQSFLGLHDGIIVNKFRCLD